MKEPSKELVAATAEPSARLSSFTRKLAMAALSGRDLGALVDAAKTGNDARAFADAADRFLGLLRVEMREVHASPDSQCTDPNCEWHGGPEA